ncbi:ZF-HD homeobox protein [Hordeum vulgare]|uniref:ZF-HD dimerization-type domain-containing protein n=1 Tax=Hordeum vulgare subsp. vulgare TaxID=112509 RepID=A0A8I7B1Q3_HORVV|nr:zinc-finger homeodomain protein 6-like [Hordeum vulgare subsp. vulgare]KAE8800922.1 ZF-HD homeobox protein [Hordeum vulgare]
MEFTGPEHAAGTRAPSDASSGNSGQARYRECLRNHAAAQGGHAVDGCGEFMPSGANDLLSCAACGCHRSFHRRDDGQQQPRLFLPALGATPTSAPRVPLLMPPPPPHHPYGAGHSQALPFLYNPHHHHYHRTPSGGGTTTESSSEEPGPGPPSTSAHGHGQTQRRKRYRTRFTAEQREQMLALAERVGWRMLKQDEALVEQLCAQAGVRRQVFKVWMHNNKHHKRQTQPPQSQQQ